MKEQYIRQVEKELHLPRRKRKEVVRDLEEIFSSAAEHGETEQQVLERLGAPKEFADSSALQFGVDTATVASRKDTVFCAAALFTAAAAFLLYAATKGEEAPAGAIGQADAMTSIQIEGFSVSAFLLAVGIIAAVLAVVRLLRFARKSRRS